MALSVSVRHSLIRALVVFAVTCVTDHFNREPDVSTIVKQRHPGIVALSVISMLFVMEVNPRELFSILLVEAMALGLIIGLLQSSTRFIPVGHNRIRRLHFAAMEGFLPFDRPPSFVLPRSNGLQRQKGSIELLAVIPPGVLPSSYWILEFVQ